MQKVRNALDLSLKPLTLPCFSSVSLAAYYLCIPGPLRASGSVSLPKIATPLEVFCKSDKKSPVFAEVMLTVPRHTSGPASDAQAQGGGRREHAKKGGSHGAERGSAARRVKGGAVALETAQQLPRPPAQLSLRKTRGQEVEAMSVAASFPKHTSFTMRASFAAADGLPETENNAGEPENTYILRPVFQQRRVEDGLWRRRPSRLLPAPGRARLIARVSGRSAAPGKGGRCVAGYGGWGGARGGGAGRGGARVLAEELEREEGA